MMCAMGKTKTLVGIICEEGKSEEAMGIGG